MRPHISSGSSPPSLWLLPRTYTMTNDNLCYQIHEKALKFIRQSIEIFARLLYNIVNETGT